MGRADTVGWCVGSVLVALFAFALLFPLDPQVVTEDSNSSNARAASQVLEVSLEQKIESGLFTRTTLQFPSEHGLIFLRHSIDWLSELLSLAFFTERRSLSSFSSGDSCPRNWISEGRSFAGSSQKLGLWSFVLCRIVCCPWNCFLCF